MDTAYWFTWYDVPDAHRADYLTWLHHRYIPMVTARDGVLWAAHYRCTESLGDSAPGRFKFIDDPACPGGTRFILIFAATAAKVFLSPTVQEFHAGPEGAGPAGAGIGGTGVEWADRAGAERAGVDRAGVDRAGPGGRLSEADRAMLAQRRGERSSVLIETDRVLGADAGAFAGPAPCIQLGSFNVPVDFEDEAAAWFARARMPSMHGTSGAVRMRTMVAVSGWARHACLYEFTSQEARRAYVARERGMPDKQPWSDRVAVRLIHMPGSPAVAERIWPPLEADLPAARPGDAAGEAGQAAGSAPQAGMAGQGTQVQGTPVQGVPGQGMPVQGTTGQGVSR